MSAGLIVGIVLAIVCCGGLFFDDCTYMAPVLLRGVATGSSVGVCITQNSVLDIFIRKKLDIRHILGIQRIFD